MRLGARTFACARTYLLESAYHVTSFCEWSSTSVNRALALIGAAPLAAHTPDVRFVESGHPLRLEVSARTQPAYRSAVEPAERRDHHAQTGWQDRSDHRSHI